MNFAIKKGWVPAMVVAVIAVMLFMPADPVTEILTVAQTFILTVAGLFVCSRVAPVTAWPSRKQRLVSWSVALSAAVVVCLEPLLFAAAKR